MIPPEKFRIEFELPYRLTLGEAETLHDRMLEVLGEHAPECLGIKVGKVVPGGSPLKDITTEGGHHD